MLFVKERSFEGEKSEVRGLNGNNETNGSKSLRNEIRSVDWKHED